MTTRPLPDSFGPGARFWAAAREHRLVVQHCPRCDRFQHFPRAWCTNCLNDDLEFVDASGGGIVYSFTVIRRAFQPWFAERVPYGYALVDLDEGVRVTTNIVDCQPADVHVGQRVRVRFDDVDDEHTVVVFAPEEGT